ncbi:MAG: 50S ribosomal protein L10 [Treponema sp. GWB1_62_6]|nr:MAG: 50S ribosomal protein L10 [Treponema sp. GWA1_62_8]OHE69635.1 MAG: 50S ribosomal protein L10 [Treponema sp. GWC1_61_84]OHE71320.1 MAG: 50S ribosomal protein L10 [Treponema sp. GWB1_62_6]HCM25027.1 50S ribosomal protein L10 [Treponema sp.]
MAIVAKNIQDVKVASIGELKESFSTAPDYIFADYRGLTVEQITNLRKQLRSKDAHFKVVKNNFARIAFEQLEAPDVAFYLTGPTAVAISPKDSNEVAKIMFDFSKETPALKVKGGLVGKTVFDSKQVEAFSRLPGRKQLISMLMSVMNGPARNLAAALNDINARLVRTVKAVGDKKSETT